MCVCVRACVRVCVRACVRVCVCDTHIPVYGYACVCKWVRDVCSVGFYTSAEFNFPPSHDCDTFYLLNTNTGQTLSTDETVTDTDR